MKINISKFTRNVLAKGAHIISKFEGGYIFWGILHKLAIFTIKK